MNYQETEFKPNIAELLTTFIVERSLLDVYNIQQMSLQSNYTLLQKILINSYTS